VSPQAHARGQQTEEWSTAAARELGLNDEQILQPVERDFLANGIRLHLLEWGTGPSEILFLHGGSLTARTWDSVCLYVGQRHRCLAVDLRGHGDSEWPANADYRLASFARDIHATIATQTRGRPIVVGHSLGGLVAVKLFAEKGVDLRGLVLVDISPSPRAEGRQEVLRFLREHDRFTSVDDLITRARSRRPGRARPLVDHAVLSNLRSLPDGEWTWKWDRRRLTDRDTHLQQQRESLWRAAATISCPVLIVRGERSNVLLEADSANFAAVVPNATAVTVPDAGHTVQNDNPRALGELIDAFCDTAD
jgi:pimeloyl-ACP methyl ester carboxylesterase